MKLVLRSAFLAGVLALGGCVSSSQESRIAARGPVGDVTNAPAGAGVNVRAGSPEDFIVNVGRRVFFAQGSAELDDVARETLNNQAAWLKTYTQYPIKVDGFTDDPGGAAENMKLGLRRAEAAKTYLVAQGVQPDRIRTRSSGNTRPTMRCADVSCKVQNRQVRTVLDAPTSSGQQPADVQRQGTTAPDEARAPGGTTVTFASGGQLTVRGRVIGEAMVRR